MTTYIGTATSRVDGRAKVTGAAKYAAEFNAVGLAHASVVTSIIARGHITRIDTSAEGIVAQAGVPRAVAGWGTALTEDQVRSLKNFARRLVLAYDADAAGQAAAERLYEWEKRYDVDIAVADLPAGSDPADLARRDPDRLRAAVTEALRRPRRRRSPAPGQSGTPLRGR